MTPHEERWNEVFGWYKDEPYEWPNFCCVPMVGDLLQHSIFEMRPQEVRSEAEHIKHWIDMHGSMRGGWDKRLRMAGCERALLGWLNDRIRFEYIDRGRLVAEVGLSEDFSGNRGALVFHPPGNKTPPLAWSIHGLLEITDFTYASRPNTGWAAPKTLREW